MDILLIILGTICLLIGLIGCVVPMLPGVPLAYVGLLLLHFTERVDFSWQFLVLWAVITIVIQVLDFVIPAWGTKKFGGTKWGASGSTIGLLIGLFMGPVGIVAGPFVGAVVGEMLYFKRYPQTTPESDTPALPNAKPQTNFNRALRAGFGSFVGFLTGTLLKCICCGVMIAYFIMELVK